MLSVHDLERVRARDLNALDLFFDEYFDRAFGLLFRLTGDRATAEDLTQETFLKLHRTLEALDPQRDPWPWVATIAANTFRDYRGSSQTRMRVLSRSIDEDATIRELRDGRMGPEETAQSRQDAALVRDALGQIPEIARAVVLLHDWQGFKHDEIGRMLGLSHGAIRQQYRRALAALAKALGASRT